MVHNNTFIKITAVLLLMPFMCKGIYVHYTELHPAQLSYASKDVQEKIGESVRDGNAVKDERNKSWKFKHHDGKSIFSEKKQLSVVKARCGYVLLDGHHKVLASIKLGAHLIAIKVIADLSELDDTQFWLEAEKRGWAHPYTIDGIRTIPPRRFEDMTDDPYRWLPYLLKGKIPENGNMKEYSGADYPVWLKVGDDIPFIEFKIGQALFKNGIVYDHEMGDNLPAYLVEDCRKILLKAQIPGLRVVPNRKHYSQLAMSIKV